MISADGVPGPDRGKGLPVLSARQLIGAATTALSLIAGAFLLALAAENAPAAIDALVAAVIVRSQAN
jgi:hypothetical protein